MGARRDRTAIASGCWPSVLALVFALAVPAVTGCDHGDASNGESSPVGDGAPSDDGGFDAPLTPGSEFYPWDGAVPLFGSCGTDHECIYAAGAKCLTTFPGGLCTRRCDNTSQCGSGVCVMNVCLPACGSDNCAGLGGMCINEGPYCVPSCGAGAPACPTGSTCDPYSVACTTDPTTDAGPNGAPCKSDLDCNGFCITDNAQVFNTVYDPAGFVDGLCASYGRAPPVAEVDGGELPASNCPDGSVVYPEFLYAGDLTLCLPACHRDSDCRPGYACFTSDGTNTYSNGFCAPINCRDGVHTCPAPHVCTLAYLDSGMGTCGP